MVRKQDLINRLAREACSGPGRWHRRRYPWLIWYRIADLVRHRVLKEPVDCRQGGIVDERDRMRGMQVRADLGTGVNVNRSRA